ncbi:MAG: hypothetical protein H0T51_06185 [Pirellulales bacterium]|nr:hypothetical protein [Pirellulales bacterium]
MATPRLIRIPARLCRTDLTRRLPRNANFHDRTGDKVKGCEVLGYAGILKPAFSAWLCRCDCGELFVTRSATLNNPSVSCGCRSHRLSGTHIYKTWQRMLRQCYDAKHQSYPRHGGRGITVCKRWRESVERFAEDLGPRPSPDHVLDLIKTGGNFTPANCRWVTRQEKLINQGMLVIEHGGQRLGVKEWAARLGMYVQALHYRIERCRDLGADLSEAVATPSGVKMPCVRAMMKGRSTPF